LSGLPSIERPNGETRLVTSPPPKPRRVLHILWRRALGEVTGPVPRARVVVLLHGEAARADGLARDADLSLWRLGPERSGEVVIDPVRRRNESLAAAFASGASFVLLVERPGLLDPGIVEALLRMLQAHDG